MSYLALYRKFRPVHFDDVKGQDHIVTTLKNQLKADRIGHAYLFCGTRGTGKTTVAKLFAKAVNCEHPIDGSPCGECAACKSIEAQVSMNIIEIDAASNNGVENIRDIVDEVRYSPTEGRYKVYIIDEVHMLSTNAFNALLKTLEEPPSYVIFILATTEVHKIPVTILSRCQRYDFKRISVDSITDRLSELISIEGIEADDKALRYIAKAGDGSMRDALSLLDQCIAFYLGKRLTYDNVLEVLGTVDIEVFAILLRNIYKGDVKECMGMLDDMVISGRELTQFVNDFTWYLRDLLIAKTADNPEEILEFSAERMEMLLHEAKVADEETLIRYIRVMSELANQVRYASQKRLVIEVALIKLCRPMMETDYSSLVQRVKQLEAKLENGTTVIMPQVEDTEKADTEDRPKELPKAVSEDLKAIAGQWKKIVLQTLPVAKSILQNAVPAPGNDNRLMLVFDNEIDMKAIEKEDRMNSVKNTIAKVTGKSVEIELKLINKESEKLTDYVDISKLIKVPIEYVD